MKQVKPGLPHLPVSGKFAVEQWASILCISVDELRAKLAADGMRTVQIGETVVIDAAWFWSDILA